MDAYSRGDVDEARTDVDDDFERTPTANPDRLPEDRYFDR
jgi:hypothetical protein